MINRGDTSAATEPNRLMIFASQRIHLNTAPNFEFSLARPNHIPYFFNQLTNDSAAQCTYFASDRFRDRLESRWKEKKEKWFGFHYKINVNQGQGLDYLIQNNVHKGVYVSKWV